MNEGPIQRPNFCGGYRCYDVAPPGETRCAKCKARERERREQARLDALRLEKEGKKR